MNWYHNHTLRQRVPTAHATSLHHDTTPVTVTAPLTPHDCDSSCDIMNHDARAEAERAAYCERARVRN